MTSWTVEADQGEIVARSIRDHQENSQSGPGVGERATGMVKALTERAPMARKVRMTLRNMMIGNAVRRKS